MREREKIEKGGKAAKSEFARNPAGGSHLQEHARGMTGIRLLVVRVLRSVYNECDTRRQGAKI